ncbi:hypothetical protein ACILG0_08765 [Pseudomonadota bacterium AL_CKDN230030165-1A_HGKHYDSX7]
MKSIPFALAALFLPTLVSAAYTPTPLEKALIEYEIREEHKGLLEGARRVIAQRMDLSRATAADVAKAYANGPSERLPAVIDTPFLLRGKVDASATQGTRVTYVTEAGATVRAELPQALTSQAEPVVLCDKLTWSDGAVLFTGCADWKTVVEQQTAQYRAEITDFLQGKPAPADVKRVVVELFVVADDMPGMSGCPDDYDRCTKAIRSTDMTREGYAAVRARLTKAGVQAER